MPVYVYEDDRDSKIYEVFQKMLDTHEFFTPDGYKCRRVFLKPQASFDSKIDPFSAQDFTDKTGKKKGTIGNLWETSHELSEIRKQKLGIDPIKEKQINDWEKQSKKQHPSRRKQQAKEKLDKMGIEVSD